MDALMLVFADVPLERLDVEAMSYADKKLAPVIASKIRKQGGDPTLGDAARVLARAYCVEATQRLRMNGPQRGTA